MGKYKKLIQEHHTVIVIVIAIVMVMLIITGYARHLLCARETREEAHSLLSRNSSSRHKITVL